MNGEPLSVGSSAPDFILPDQDGKKHALADYRGRWVFLYFYPKDSIAGCIRESCVLRDHFQEFQDLGIAILGISIDSAENHKQFAEKYRLPFPLLSDTREKIARQYGAIAKEHLPVNQEDIAQISFLINLAGEIEKIYQHVRPEMHASQVLADFAKIKKEDRDAIEL